MTFLSNESTVHVNMYYFQAVDAKAVRNAAAKYISDKDPCWAAMGPSEGMAFYDIVHLRNCFGRASSRLTPYLIGGW